MKGFLNLLARAKLIELSEDEQRSVSGEPPPAAPAPPSETLAELPVPSTSEAGGDPGATPTARERPELVDAAEDFAGHAFADIFVTAGVPASPYPAEKLLRLLDGLRAMDAGTRKAAVLAMDAADDNWQITDCLRDAELKVAALDEHKRQLAVQMQDRERQSAELVEQIKGTLDQATTAIRQQISELEQLLEREVTRAAQEATHVEASLRSSREAAARETRRIDAEVERLREIPNTFKAAGAAH